MIKRLGIGIVDEEKIAIGFKLILEGLGLNIKDNPHLASTPERAARAWYNELCRGLTQDAPKITTFESDVDEMVMLRHIPIRSICAHHLLPFLGEATIAYVPGTGKLLGLSKLSRIADYYARRPQVQEDLTAQIADSIAELVINTKAEIRGGVGVVIRARHLCMELRGVNHTGDMITSAVRGVFLTKPEARAEFLELRQEIRTNI